MSSNNPNNERAKEMATDREEIDNLVARGYLVVPPVNPGDPLVVLDRDGEFFKEFPAFTKRMDSFGNWEKAE